jgi:hypothetical protein
MRIALALLFLLACSPSLHEIEIRDSWEPHEARLIAVEKVEPIIEARWGEDVWERHSKSRAG